ncbi:hypothetical protein SLEP1_g1971 [Rubroshorea leprosula]|uniref:Peptidase A1 domain-containing protein n=1 Tax=Rubroshorea leprosula TaxID=152421 RepID=A0AAV5HPB2_9ROSI|nr:hypothetical protein SLEP1_g1971 [Rubroshorea leprosula]
MARLVASFLLSSMLVTTAIAASIFSVKSKYAGQERSLAAFKEHDSLRQLRILAVAGVDLPLGSSGRHDAVGLYYAKIGIGTPTKNYYMQVDTGSDLMWVNCIQCKECPKRSSLGIDLTLYDINDSSTGRMVYCDQEFCQEINGGQLNGCKANMSMSCPYLEIYGDGSSTAGYFVSDDVQYDRVSGDLQTTAGNGSVIFGCGARQSGNLDSSNEEALDGILGFGKANSSVISQLAASGKMKKMFAHCLDGVNGGGIFAIGYVVQPKVNMTSLIPNHLGGKHYILGWIGYQIFKRDEPFGLHDRPHYNVNMTAVQVGGDFLKFTTDLSEVGERGTIIDSGTTLAYLPEMIYEPLVNKIISQQPDLKVRTLHDDYTCFQYSERYDA